MKLFSLTRSHVTLLYEKNKRSQSHLTPLTPGVLPNEKKKSKTGTVISSWENKALDDEDMKPEMKWYQLEFL